MDSWAFLSMYARAHTTQNHSQRHCNVITTFCNFIKSKMELCKHGDTACYCVRAGQGSYWFKNVDWREWALDTHRLFLYDVGCIRYIPWDRYASLPSKTLSFLVEFRSVEQRCTWKITWKLHHSCWGPACNACCTFAHAFSPLSLHSNASTHLHLPFLTHSWKGTLQADTRNDGNHGRVRRCRAVQVLLQPHSQVSQSKHIYINVCGVIHHQTSFWLQITQSLARVQLETCKSQDMLWPN
jgi:hypothetical protein